jgi:hypothetical protein
LALCLLAVASAAQTPASPGDASARLHAAWIREVLDLDVRGACAEYEAIADDVRPNNLERWVAVARLFELQRAGVASARPLPLVEAPEMLREAIGKLPPPPEPFSLDPLLGDPAAVWQALSTNALKLPEPRPLGDVPQRWHGTQGVGDRLRYVQRMTAQNPNRTRPSQSDGPRIRLANAFSVLRAELQGQRELAAGLRRFEFPEWKPTPMAPDPVALLPRLRVQLDAWLAEPDLGELQRTQLRTLRDAVELRPAKDLVELIGRVPLVGERLFAEPKADEGKTGDKKPGDGK